MHATSGSQVWSQNKGSVYHFPLKKGNGITQDFLFLLEEEDRLTIFLHIAPPQLYLAPSIISLWARIHFTLRTPFFFISHPCFNFMLRAPLMFTNLAPLPHLFHVLPYAPHFSLSRTPVLVLCCEYPLMFTNLAPLPHLFHVLLRAPP